jgi:ribonuclease D
MTNAPDPAAGPVELVASAEALADLSAALAREAEVALDSEANSLFAFRERTCVLQVTAGTRSAIVDVLAIADLTPLRTALDREDLLVVFHGGDYDVSILSRDHGFRFRRVFDTMIAATILGDEKVGLADLVREAYGVELDKRFQKADWGRRPLTPEQVAYLHRDTAYLPGLCTRFRGRLEAADLVEEAEIEFARLARRRGEERAFDPEGWRRIKGSATLDATGRAVLHALHAWREAEAERRDLPAFKVVGPDALLALARRPPPDGTPPGRLFALAPRERERYGAGIAEALREGWRIAGAGKAPGPDRGERVPPAEQALRKVWRRREEALRDWRRDAASKRRVPPLVVLPNPALLALVRDPPPDLEALARVPDLGTKRLALYGDQILEVLSKTG